MPARLAWSGALYVMEVMRRACQLWIAVALSVGYSAFAADEKTVTLVVPAPVGRAAQHGIETLRASLGEAGWTMASASRINTAPGRYVILAGLGSEESEVQQELRASHVAFSTQSESLAIQARSLG